MEFRCKDCGSTELYVEAGYNITEEMVDLLECACEKENDFAAKRTYYATTSYLEKMELNEDHRFGPVYDSEEQKTTEEETDYEIRCHECLGKAQQNDWSTEVISSEIDEDSHEFYVRCLCCDREIELGWSHPGRAGRIWPVESSDFNPWKSWPEPRYRAKWLEPDVVAGGIQYIIAAPPTIATEQATMFIFVAVYLGIGLGIWLYWDVIKKVNSVSENILKVR